MILYPELGLKSIGGVWNGCKKRINPCGPPSEPVTFSFIKRCLLYGQTRIRLNSNDNILKRLLNIHLTERRWRSVNLSRKYGPPKLCSSIIHPIAPPARLLSKRSGYLTTTGKLRWPVGGSHHVYHRFQVGHTSIVQIYGVAIQTPSRGGSNITAGAPAAGWSW
jgi:hypothetical protein